MLGLRSHRQVDVPFEFRGCCWFCKEPVRGTLKFPAEQRLAFDCPHPHLILPACDECKRLANECKTTDISSCRHYVKQGLIKRYQKHLAIGVNWTKEELENSALEGKAFDGFKKSGWMMFEIAQQRVNFEGWPLSIDYQLLELDSVQESFDFDGTSFPSVQSAIEYYCQAFYLDRDFVEQLLIKLGKTQFARVISLARININLSKKERQQFLHALVINQTVQ